MAYKAFMLINDENEDKITRVTRRLVSDKLLAFWLKTVCHAFNLVILFIWSISCIKIKVKINNIHKMKL